MKELFLYASMEASRTLLGFLEARPSTLTVQQSVTDVRCFLVLASFFLFSLQFLIVILCFTTFSVSAELPQNRLQLSFTLVLTAIAFKFVVNHPTP